MKNFFIACTLSLCCVFLSGCTVLPTINSQQTTKRVEKNRKTTLTGTLTALPGATGDATHILKTSEASVFVNSYAVTLKNYENQKVELVGEYSGDTLFVDSATVVQ